MDACLMDQMDQGDAVGEKRQATLRSRPASLTATARRRCSDHGGTAAGEGAR
ncbi:DUF6380 family protein [Streptomyces sp. NPDC026665]|uniref:DUF6380 family protein n=1 Tax=Streptomyces sp. NPDC026665 TaxID=3154798 RepID=UPI0033D699A5